MAADARLLGLGLAAFWRRLRNIAMLAVALAGFRRPGTLRGHSARAGAATAANLLGMSRVDLAARGGWVADSAAMLRYIHPHQDFC